MNTNEKGAIAEAAITAEAIKLGIQVLKPVAEHGRYDVAFDLGDRIIRVQCKWANRRGAVVQIPVGGSRTTVRGYVRSTYLEHEIDALAAYCMEIDRCYLLPVSMVAGKHGIHLRLGPTKNAQKVAIHWCAEYELGAVAQLGERRGGTAKVTGSSPVSSTSSRPETAALKFPDSDRAGSLKASVGMDEFDAQLAQYVRHAQAGNEVLVTRWGRPVARLSPPFSPLPE